MDVFARPCLYAALSTVNAHGFFDCEEYGTEGIPGILARHESLHGFLARIEKLVFWHKLSSWYSGTN